MPEGSPGAGWDLRRLFSPGTQAHEGREDPHTEPHVPAHAAPGNPTPITLEDMSDQEGVGSASKAEATLTHPSARDKCLLNADEMVGTGPLRMARTQKNEVVSPVGSFTNGEQR